jgi:hypothetical protein
MVFAGIRVYTGFKEHGALAEQEFADLANLAATLGVSGFMDEPFRETIRETIITSKTLQGVIVSSSQGEYAFERDRGTIITWIGDSPHFKPQFQFGIAKTPFFERLQIEGLQNVTLSVVYSFIDYDSLITILKQTLWVILATLGLALCILIVQIILAKSKTEMIPSPPRSATFYTRNQDKEEKGGVKDKDASLEDEPFFSKNVKDTPKPSALKTEAAFTARTYIGKEPNTKDRLATELNRCATSEQDLVFMVLELKDETRPQEAYRLLVDEAIKMFFRRDLMFEKGDLGISIILPSTDLDQGFSKSQEFQKRILNKYTESFKDNTEVYMGMSSRSKRLVDAERLMFEASGALQRAMKDPGSSIVAFRSDPEKYRAFIASQNQSHS